MGRAQGKVAIVTGGGRGIGRQCAVALAEAGADVAVVDLDAKGAAEAADAVRAIGRRALAIECDVTSAAAVAACDCVPGLLSVFLTVALLQATSKVITMIR